MLDLPATGAERVLECDLTTVCGVDNADLAETSVSDPVTAARSGVVATVLITWSSVVKKRISRCNS